VPGLDLDGGHRPTRWHGGDVDHDEHHLLDDDQRLIDPDQHQHVDRQHDYHGDHAHDPKHSVTCSHNPKHVRYVDNVNDSGHHVDNDDTAGDQHDLGSEHHARRDHDPNHDLNHDPNHDLNHDPNHDRHDALHDRYTYVERLHPLDRQCVDELCDSAVIDHHSIHDHHEHDKRLNTRDHRRTVDAVDAHHAYDDHDEHRRVDQQQRTDHQQHTDDDHDHGAHHDGGRSGRRPLHRGPAAVLDRRRREQLGDGQGVERNAHRWSSRLGRHHRGPPDHHR
jgi:hypothetical protein